MVALPAVASTWSTVLHGDQGVQIPFEGVPDALRRVVALEQWQAMVAVVVTAAVVTGLTVLRGGRFGLRMLAVRDDEVAARLSGIPAGRVKVLAFTASSVAAGVGGAVLCFVAQAVSPGAYTVGFSLLLVVAVVIGGLGSILGAALGSVVIVLLPWLIGRLTVEPPGRRRPATGREPRGPRLRAPAHHRDGGRPARPARRARRPTSPRQPRPPDGPRPTEEPAPRKVLVPTEEQR